MSLAVRFDFRHDKSRWRYTPRESTAETLLNLPTIRVRSGGDGTRSSVLYQAATVLSSKARLLSWINSELKSRKDIGTALAAAGKSS